MCVSYIRNDYSLNEGVMRGLTSTLSECYVRTAEIILIKLTKRK